MAGVMTVTFSLVVPVNTPARAPATVEKQCGVPGVVGGYIQIPAGCAGLVGVRLYNRSTPIYPLDYGWVTGDGAQLPLPGGFVMDGPPYILRGECYNLDDTYPHTITFSVNIALERLARGWQ